MVQTAQATVDLTTKDLATVMQITPRMVNIYRAAVEQRIGKTIGYKVGKVVFFSEDDQALIRQERDRGTSARDVGNQARERASGATFSTEQTDSNMGSALGGLVEKSDQHAIATGQALAQRWNTVFTASFQQGLAEQMGAIQDDVIDEIQAVIDCSLPALDNRILGGIRPPLSLVGGND